MKKSLLSLALAGSMLSALAVPAFAATPTDVVGKPVQSAVEALTALGIVQGYADGTFKPDNTITRAELAKIVIVATGNESAAKLMANTPPSFKDVKKGAWYTGYINAAATKGFIQGYNGNFRPNDTLKFEEVTAILVRALGYKDKYLSGSWPYNVLLQADEVGLFSGVELAAGTNATRGVVAELTENALSENLVEYNADGDKLNVKKDGVEQLLINKLGTGSTEVVKGLSVTDGKIAFVNGDPVAVADSYYITGGKKLADLVGHTVSVLKNKDGKIVAITDSQAASNIVTTNTDATTSTGAPASTTFARSSAAAGATPATFVIGGVTYTTTTDFVVYNNTDIATTNSLTVNGAEEVQIFKNSAGLVQAVLVNDWKSNIVLGSVVAYTNYSRVVSKEGVGASFTSKVDANTSITLNGQPATLADLKANDVINVIENTADTALKIVATRTVVTGKVEATGSDSNTATVKVAGTTYKNVSGSVPAFNTEYTFYLNKDNEVVFFATPDAVSASTYGVIYDVKANTSILVDGEVQEGWTKVVYYSLKDQAVKTVYTKDPETTATTATGAPVSLINKLVELKFNSDGKIDLADEQINASVDVTTATGTVSADPTATKLSVGNANYVLNSNTIYLKVGIDTDITKNTVTNATAADVAKNDAVVVKASNGVAQYVIIKTKASAGAELPKAQGLFVSQSTVTSADGTVVNTVKLNVNGEEKTFAVKDAFTTVPAKNAIVTLTDDTTVTTANSVYEGKDVWATEASTISVDSAAKTVAVPGATAGSTDTYLVTGNTQIVLLNKKDGTINQGTFTDIAVAGDKVDNVLVNYGITNGKFKLIVKGTGAHYGSATGPEEAGVVIVVAYHD